MIVRLITNKFVVSPLSSKIMLRRVAKKKLMTIQNEGRVVTMSKFLNKNNFLVFNFSSSNKNYENNEDSQKEKDEKINKEELLYLKKERTTNQMSNLPPDHSFQTDLLLSQQRYKHQISQLKEAILFEDLLKSEIDILIYDTGAKPYYTQLVKFFLTVACIIGLFYSLKINFFANKRFKTIFQKTTQGKFFIFLLKSICGIIFLILLLRYPKFVDIFVEKIVYHTQTESFTFTKRRYWGTKKTQQISRFKILYTQNSTLNKGNINYINLSNMNFYSIGYTFAWKKEDLFSHLISQRIKV